MTAQRLFWPTILLLAVVTLALAVTGWLRSPRTVNLDDRTFDQRQAEAAAMTDDEIGARIYERLEPVYAPVHAAVPGYADFHYSVLGEYTELTEAALGQMAGAMEARLYAGFEARLTEATGRIEAERAAVFAANLQSGVAAELPEGTLLGEATRVAMADAVARVRLSAPLAAVSAATGPAAVKAVAATLARKLGARIAAKAGAKVAGKGAGVLGGAGTGAGFCAPGGPLASAACGIIGGVVAWVAVDYAAIKLDEYFNRDEFEADLHKLIEEDRAAMAAALRAALAGAAQPH